MGEDRSGPLAGPVVVGMASVSLGSGPHEAIRLRLVHRDGDEVARHDRALGSGLASGHLITSGLYEEVHGVLRISKEKAVSPEAIQTRHPFDRRENLADAGSRRQGKGGEERGVACQNIVHRGDMDDVSLDVPLAIEDRGEGHDTKIELSAVKQVKGTPPPLELADSIVRGGCGVKLGLPEARAECLEARAIVCRRDGEEGLAVHREKGHLAGQFGPRVGFAWGGGRACASRKAKGGQCAEQDEERVSQQTPCCGRDAE